MAGLEARLVISAEDRASAVLSKLKEQISSIEKVAGPLGKAMGAVGPVAKSVEAFKLPATLPAEMTKMVGTISSVDRVMKDVGRSSVGVAGNIGKASAEVVQLSGRLMDAGSKLKAIGDFKLSARGVKDASTAMQKAEQDARALAAKIDGVPSPARSMVAAHAGALAEVRETERALERQTATAAAARTALAEMGVPLSRLREEETQLRSAIAGTNDALLRQIELDGRAAAAAEQAARAQRMSAEQEKRHHDALLARFAAEDHARHAAGAAHGGGEHAGHGVVNYALTSAAMAVSAHEIGHVIGEAIHEGAELQHERIQLTNAGRTPEEMREIEAAGRSTISQLPTANFTETMKVIAETTSAFGSVHHAIDNLPFMMKTMEVLKSAGGDKIQGDAGTVGRFFAKTFEERMTKPEEFQNEARMMIPAMVASGGVFNPEQLYGFAQQAKSALPNYDMRFLSKIVPSIVTAMGGQRAGTAANAFNSIIMGKVNDKKQAEAWEKFGLLDNTKVLKKAGNVVSWTAGAVKDTNLALSDPLKWAETVALPAMIAKGVKVDDRLELAKELGTMFRNQNGNMFANEMMQEASRSRLHKDEALYNKTGDLDELYQNDLGEFHVGAEALGEALKTLAAATTAPMMHETAIALSGLAGAIQQVSAAALRHPTTAATAGVGAAAAALGSAGWLGMRLMNGFGLKGSAVALDASAASLEAAAVRLGAGGGIPHGGGPMLGNVGKGAAAAEGSLTTGELVAAAIPEIATAAAAVVTLMGAAAVTKLVKASQEAQEPGKGGQWAPPTPATEDLDRQRLKDQEDEARDLRHQIAEEQFKSKLPPGEESPNMLALRDRLAQVEGQARTLRDRLGKLYDSPDREAERGKAMMGRFGPLRDYGPDMKDLPGGWKAPGPHWGHEMFGPEMPPLAVAPGYPGVDRRTFGSYLQQMAPLAAEGAMPAARPPTASAAPPLPSGPISVQIVGTTTERMPTGPLGPGMHRDFTLGNRTEGFGSPGFGASDHFDEGPRRGPNLSMLDAHPVEPHVDDSQLVAFDGKLTETQGKMREVGATTMAPVVNSGSIDAYIAKLERAAALEKSLGKVGGGAGGGTSGSVGPSYPQTAPAGRNGGGR